MEKTIDFAKPGGRTALIDTVYLGLSRMREPHRSRRALLILSDGMDNQSRYSKSELMRMALEADVQIYTVIMDGLGDAASNAVPFRPSMIRKPGDHAQENEGPDLLEKLADRTGGLHFHAHNDAEARDDAIKAGQAIRDEYLIGFQPINPGAAGKWHQVRIKSKAPKVNIHARNGYYSP